MLAIHQIFLAFVLAFSVTADDSVQIFKSSVSSYVLHLSQGADVITALTNLLAEKPHQAITMITAHGKVHSCSLWLPNSTTLIRYNKTLQFTSIAGNIDQQLIPNIWVIFRDEGQSVVAGKLPTLARRKQQQTGNTHNTKNDCTVKQSLRLTLINHEDFKFKRDINTDGNPLKIIEV